MIGSLHVVVIVFGVIRDVWCEFAVSLFFAVQVLFRSEIFAVRAGKTDIDGRFSTFSNH